MTHQSPKRYVIIGAAAAGLGALNKLRMLDPQADIVCVSDEQENPYNKCLLADYMTNQPTSSKIQMLSAEQAEQKKIDLRLSTRVVSIAADNNHIMVESGESIRYDSLLIATGSSPRKLAITGVDHADGVFTFHTLRDVNRITSYVKEHTVKHAVVIGAGLSGLECADALMQLGVAVTIVEKSSHVLSTQLGPDAARVIELAMQLQGVRLYTAATVTEIKSADSMLTSVILNDGTALEAQLVIIAAGLVPNSGIAQQAGIATHNGSILVNEYLQTNVSNIYAAGDVILIKDPLTGNLVPSCTWPDAMMQGMIAASHMTGTPKPYIAQPIMTSSAFFGLKFAACGQIRQENKHLWVVRADEKNCSSFFVSDGGCLQGFNVVGPTVDFGSLRRLVLTKQPVTLEHLYSL